MPTTRTLNPLQFQPGDTIASYNARNPSGVPGYRFPSAQSTPDFLQSTTQPPVYTPNRGLTGASALSGDELNASLNNQFDTGATNQTILQAYRSQLGANVAGNESSNRYLSGLTDTDIANQKYETALLENQSNESRRGFATNPGIINTIQNRSDAIVSKLKTNLADAIASNQSQLVKANADALATEISNMSAARTNFLSQYFNTQSESRAQTLLPTEIAATQAGIRSTLATAAATPVQARAATTSAGASVTSAGAQALQANIAKQQNDYFIQQLNSIDDNDQDVADLKSGKITPDQLREKYANISINGVPMGAAKAQAIISKAQQSESGYSVNAGTLSGISQEAQTRALSSGNPASIIGGFSTRALQAGARLLIGNPPTNSPTYLSNPSTIRMSGPGGVFDVPFNKINLFKKNGYK